MNRLRIVFPLVLFIIFHCTAQLDTTRIDSIVQKAVTTDTFEGTILIADKGAISYHESFGFTDTDKVTPVSNSAHFSVASVTKLFTAIAIIG